MRIVGRRFVKVGSFEGIFEVIIGNVVIVVILEEGGAKLLTKAVMELADMSIVGMLGADFTA